MTGCLIGATRDDALARARRLYDRRSRGVDFDGWLAGLREHSLVGSVEDVAARLREYEQAGCERVLLQHLLHTDLEPVRLIGQELAAAIS
jgi:alkanesulfonate monooxygenase SsuD/methylene tetrahydromethanopterin reductase-like flavin-dependent oxidoreductase (luciferase family)